MPMKTPSRIPSCLFLSPFKRIASTRTLIAGAAILVALLVFNACWFCHPQVSPIPFQQSYAVLQPALDGGYYRTANKMLRFQYTEEYQVSATNDKLSYKVYDRLRSTSLGVDNNGVPIISGSPSKAVAFGDNR